MYDAVRHFISECEKDRLCWAKERAPHSKIHRNADRLASFLTLLTIFKSGELSTWLFRASVTLLHPQRLFCDLKHYRGSKCSRENTLYVKFAGEDLVLSANLTLNLFFFNVRSDKILFSFKLLNNTALLKMNVFFFFCWCC